MDIDTKYGKKQFCSGLTLDNNSNDKIFLVLICSICKLDDSCSYDLKLQTYFHRLILLYIIIFKHLARDDVNVYKQQTTV